MSLLRLDDVHTFIEQFHILEGVTVDVPEGSVVALLGRNGAGKTTTLKTILGLTPPRSGSVTFDGRDLAGMRSFDIAALGIGYVPENRAIFSDLSVEENLRIAEREKGDLDRKEELIFGLFPDLKRLIGLPGTSLSGGQQQMLAVARALVPDNRLLLIDHSEAFCLLTDIGPILNDSAFEIDAALYEALKGLDEKVLEERVGDLLSAEQRAAILARRDTLLEKSGS
mgnify:CR=1 FL=1